MDSLVIYLIIGAVWIFQVLTKKKREAEIGQKPAQKEPEKGIFDDLKDLLEEKYQPVLSEDASQEIETQMAEPVEAQQIEMENCSAPVPEKSSEPDLKKPSNDLTSDTLEQGIILSVILGPPRGQSATSPGISRHLLLLH